MSRRTAARFGKMPNTSVRCRICLVRRSWGSFDQTYFRWATEEAFVEHAHHGAVFRVYLLGRQLLIDRPHDGRHPGLARRGILKSRLDMKWVRQRCHEAPAMASFSPPWASEVTISNPAYALSRARAPLAPLSALPPTPPTAP